MAQPQEFDVDQVLEKAMLLAWNKGYESTSPTDIQDATGVSWPNLNKAFGNKEGLFRTALDRYKQKNLAFRANAFAQPTPRLIVRTLLLGFVDLDTESSTPSGRLVALSALACMGNMGPLGDSLLQIRNEFERNLRERLKSVMDAGPLPDGMTAHDAAAFISTMIQGMAVQAKSGATRRRLREIVDAVLANWPADFRDPEQHQAGAG
ncbi:TetR family transcriptional regulator [Paraburkholderia sp. CNPSo 3157]|uniref:TetR family transcriptional regulator n=1 Tax=Paraburkholderia franconis TaxID=2654983 RepID=A0A7X1TH76_9BURK|nr:TetR/AcrR family transcriptional regulator [Paraburkholderia franconis]MPW19242.1 TetR family transcriptional regulator [Paraburkholderia franconis]